ncbi:MAG: metallophosphoesterase family protein [Candidatus Pacearchaeota archaeon]
MKFAHIADVHLGAWKQPELQNLSLKAFDIAIEKSIKEKVDFVIIAGDLFDVAMPGVDVLKEAVTILKRLKDNGIKCFLLAGSHDFSITGKTFLDVLERADLFKNIFVLNQKENELEFFHDSSLKVSLAGVAGKKAGIEVNLFKNLNIKGTAPREHTKIFIFHTTLTESKPEEMEFVDSIALSDLPEGFDYYAGGHLHLFAKHKKGAAFVTYPGPLFPNNFEELKKLQHGRFFIVDIDEKTKETQIKDEEVKLKDILSIDCDVDALTPMAATTKILDEISKAEVKDKILLLKISGTLTSGKTSDIDFDKIREALHESYCYLKNTSGLSIKEFKIDIEDKGDDIETIERNLILEYSKKETDFLEFLPLIAQLNSILDTEKYEGETKEEYESRIIADFKKVFTEINEIKDIETNK